jgi:hypothetical protein
MTHRNIKLSFCYIEATLLGLTVRVEGKIIFEPNSSKIILVLTVEKTKFTYYIFNQ